MKVGRAGARLEPRARVGGGGVGRGRGREGRELNWTGKEEPSDQTKIVWHYASILEGRGPTDTQGRERA